jgi:predicted Fe-Mo cluster-binding NifX family protein
MQKKIAIPLEDGILSSHFGHSQQFAIVETRDGEILNEKLLVPPPHEPGVIPAWLAQHDVTDVIAGGMGQKAITLFNNHKINVFVGAEKKAFRELAADLVNGTLTAGANYCDH